METNFSPAKAGNSTPWTLDLQQALDTVTQLQRVEIPRAEIPAVLSQLATAQTALAAAQGALATRIATFSSDRDRQSDTQRCRPTERPADGDSTRYRPRPGGRSAGRLEGRSRFGAGA